MANNPLRLAFISKGEALYLRLPSGRRMELHREGGNGASRLSVGSRTVVRTDTSGNPKIRILNEGGSKIRDFRFHRDGSWWVTAKELSSWVPLSGLDPVRRPLRLAGLDVLNCLSRVNPDEWPDAAEGDWTDHKNWLIQFHRKDFRHPANIKKIYVRKDESNALGEQDIAEFSGALARACFGDFADNRFLEVWDDENDEVLSWFKENFELQDVPLSLCCFQFTHRTSGETWTGLFHPLLNSSLVSQHFDVSRL